MAKQTEIISLKDPRVVPTNKWHQLDEGRIQCDLCPRFCKLKEGQRGLCFVPACVEGQIVLTTYGRSSGYCVDPIEKNPSITSCQGFGTACAGVFETDPATWCSRRQPVRLSDFRVSSA